MGRGKRRRAECCRIFLPAVLAACLILAAPVYADSGETAAYALSYLIGEIFSLIADIVTGIGGILLLYYAFDMGGNMNSQDRTAVYKSFRGIAGGCICLVFPSVIESVLGITVLTESSGGGALRIGMGLLGI